MTEKELLNIVSEIEDKKNDQIDLKKIFLNYRNNWYWFAIASLLLVSLAFLYLRYTTPQYAITSKLLIKDDTKGPDLGSNTVFSDLGIFNSSKNVLNEIEVLKSQVLMEHVLQDLSLYCSYFLEGTIKDQEIYGRELPIRMVVTNLDSTAYEKELVIRLANNKSFQLGELNEDGDITKWEKYSFGEEIARTYGVFSVLALTDILRVKEEKKNISVHFNDIPKLAQAYNKKIEIELVNEDAAILVISLESAIAAKGKDVINKLIEEYNKEDVEDKNQIAANTVKFIDERLDYIASDLTGVEKNVEEFKRENELTDVSSEASMYLEEATDYNKQLAELEIKIDVLNSVEPYLNKPDNQYALIPGSVSISDPTLQEPITQFNELILQRQRLLRTLPEENPLVQNLSEQLSNLRANINQNLKNVKESLEIKKRNIDASSRRFSSRIEQVPTMQRKLMEISRQQGIKEKLYLYLLQKQEEANLSLAASVSNSRIIDPATASNDPVSPKKGLIYAFALFMGLAIPVGGIYLRDITDDKVRSKKEVEKNTRTPILGEVPHSFSSSQLVVTEKSREPIAEVFRLIRNNLNFMAVGNKNKVLLVTSGMQGEGKTFFSINLGASLALIGKKVLIMDFDLRKPNVLKSLELSENKGITDYITADKAYIDDYLILLNKFPNFFVISSGTIPPNPNELMTSEKVGLLIEKLREKFDYIIIDTAPVGLVADALSLAPYIDSTIYMVRYNTTYKSQLEVVDDLHRNKKLKNAVIVLNDKKERAKINTYGYYSQDTNK
ncbi:GumC family protein [Flavimarina sp. Hel_I_48]|uniref:GumC family protein n=1 Tax=Flavimarina sp. Hel_I_48 TaxID=1392488 RepID=UPI0004DEE9C5|nr:tyrosine-protein kinase [Flavimarina sp. Hel_I_48]